MGLRSGAHRSAAALVDRLRDRQVPAEGTSAAASHASEDGHSIVQPCHRRRNHGCSDALAPELLLCLGCCHTSPQVRLTDLKQGSSVQACSGALGSGPGLPHAMCVWCVWRQGWQYVPDRTPGACRSRLGRA